MNLNKVIDLIKQGWTQHAIARDKDEKPVSWNDPMAVSYCIEGACHKAGVALYRLSEAIYRIHGTTTTRFNDRSTKEQVLATLEKINDSL